jgi:hypothetical protein
MSQEREMRVYFFQVLLIRLGIYILLNLEKIADRLYEFFSQKSFAGVATSSRWNKIVLVPMSIMMIILGLANILIIIQELK